MSKFHVNAAGKHHRIVADHYKVNSGYVEFYSEGGEKYAERVAFFPIHDGLSIFLDTAVNLPIDPSEDSDIPF